VIGQSKQVCEHGKTDSTLSKRQPTEKNYYNSEPGDPKMYC